MTLALAAAAAAFFTALTLSLMVARTGPVDAVKLRSSHDTPTPTTGGLAILAAAALGAALTPADSAVALLVGAAALLGLFGAIDDLNDFPASLKFGAQAAASFAIAILVARVTQLPFGSGATLALPALLGAAGSAVFLVLLLNAVNFMDGADRLAGGVALLALATLGAAALLAGERGIGLAALAAAAANAGFLVLNRRELLFQGDAGAFFSALMIGGIGLLLAQRGAASPWLVVFTVLPLLVDVLLTLALRAARRERLTEAHRDHLYQVWLRATRRPHRELAVLMGLITAGCCGLGLALERYAPQWSFTGLAALALVLAAGWGAARRRYAARLTA